MSIPLVDAQLQDQLQLMIKIYSKLESGSCSHEEQLIALALIMKHSMMTAAIMSRDQDVTDELFKLNSLIIKADHRDYNSMLELRRLVNKGKDLIVQANKDLFQKFGN